jgi:hypothetical protein
MRAKEIDRLTVRSDRWTKVAVAERADLYERYGASSRPSRYTSRRLGIDDGSTGTSSNWIRAFPPKRSALLDRAKRARTTRERSGGRHGRRAALRG